MVAKAPRDHPRTEAWSNDMRVVIVVHRARGIQPSSNGGISNPYCTMNIGVEKHKTRVLKHVIYPVWEERVVFGNKASGSHAKAFGIPGPSSPDSVITFKIKSYDRLKNVDIGEVRVALWDLERQGLVRQWHSLVAVPAQSNSNGMGAGEIDLSIELVNKSAILGSNTRRS